MENDIDISHINIFILVYMLNVLNVYGVIQSKISESFCEICCLVYENFIVIYVW
jgi:hypothetical protein